MTTRNDPLAALLELVKSYDKDEIERTERCPTGDDYNNLFSLVTAFAPLADSPPEEPGAPTVYECEECDWSGTLDQIDGIHHIHHIQERVEPGELVPAGVCPECRALIGVADRDVPHDTLYHVARIMQARGWTVAAPKACPPVKGA